MMRRLFEPLLYRTLMLVAAAAACGAGRTRAPSSTASATPDAVSGDASPAISAAAPSCGGAELRVSFFDVGQGLAVLVALPDGRHLVVDTGEVSRRPGCGPACNEWHRHFETALAADLGDAPIDMLWITHPHSDHAGGAVDVLNHFAVRHYVDNGRELAKALVETARQAASAHGVPITTVEPQQTAVPIPDTEDVKLTAIVPSRWSAECTRDENLCSIGLRVDYCASSILFTGDAEAGEERAWNIGGPVTLLQVGHHGSATSSTATLLDQAMPRYAVISVGHPDEATNRKYCHPRKQTIDELTARLGGPGISTIRAFSSTTDCGMHASPSDWSDVPASDRLWATSRDGDVVLTTTGDGSFQRR